MSNENILDELQNPNVLVVCANDYYRGKEYVVQFTSSKNDKDIYLFYNSSIYVNLHWMMMIYLAK
jgi:hypothetical protein